MATKEIKHSHKVFYGAGELTPGWVLGAQLWWPKFRSQGPRNQPRVLSHLPLKLAVRKAVSRGSLGFAGGHELQGSGNKAKSDRRERFMLTSDLCAHVCINYTSALHSTLTNFISSKKQSRQIIFPPGETSWLVIRFQVISPEITYMGHGRTQ